MKIINWFKVVYKKIRNVFKPHWNNKNKRLKHVYTDKFGNRYYELEDIREISYSRSIAAEVASRQADYNLTKDDLLKIIYQIMSYINANSIVEASALLNELKERAQFAGEVETLLHLASVYFLIEGEDIDNYLQYEQDKKINLWREDGAAMSFFLNGAFQRTKNYTVIFGTDITPYLKVAERSQKNLNQILSTSQ